MRRNALSLVYIGLVLTLLTACTPMTETQDDPYYDALEVLITYEKDGLVAYSGFDDIPEDYRYEEALDDGCIEAYEMTKEEIELMVSHLQVAADKGQSSKVRFIKFMEEDKKGMFFEDLCHYNGKFYIFDNRNDLSLDYGYEYIKITYSLKNPDFGHLILTDNMDTIADDVLMKYASSYYAPGQPEFTDVMFMPYDRPVKLEVYTFGHIPERPASDAITQMITSYMQESDIHDVSAGGLECSIIDIDGLEDLTLVRAKLDYGWIDGVAIMAEETIVGMFTGMDAQKFFLTDLNDDGIDEILFHSYMGSGLLRHHLGVFDLEDYRFTTYTIFNDNKNIKFQAEPDGVYIYSYTFETLIRGDEPLGKLVYDGDVLFIEGYDDIVD